jgi:hypothetical protein
MTRMEFIQIGSDDIVQDAQTIAFARLVEPVQPLFAVPGEFQKELLFVAAVGDMPDVSGKEMSIGSWHALPP